MLIDNNNKCLLEQSTLFVSPESPGIGANVCRTLSHRLIMPFIRCAASSQTVSSEHISTW